MSAPTRKQSRHKRHQRQHLAFEARKRLALVVVAEDVARRRRVAKGLGGALLVAGVAGVVALVIGARPAPSSYVEKSVASVATHVRPEGASGVFPAVSVLSAAVNGRGGRLRVTKVATSPIEVSIVESPGRRQAVVVGTDGAWCIGVAVHGVSDPSAPTLRNVPGEPGFAFATWSVPAAGCSPWTVPAGTRWGPSWSAARG